MLAFLYFYFISPKVNALIFFDIFLYILSATINEILFANKKLMKINYVPGYSIFQQVISQLL
ncbi:hypothetical protein B6D60_00090 [candidate division KSB1 bacterium 4484_87]|nr:MAG: hypothetical protein B6D60_00090 [candidate division KSB1 bacterium 4484_87]